ncbi:unnamed protein product [Rotaria sordida]|uniref:Uncharacterized protein n=1 Tax=Rotaria sordida TaxID=392033 RepID=A0A819DEW4_9BILA|nr:unnamed protein product [Rotaria sordida]
MWLCKEAGVEDQQAIEQLKDICMQDMENIEDMNILQDILADLDFWKVRARLCRSSSLSKSDMSNSCLSTNKFDLDY